MALGKGGVSANTIFVGVTLLPDTKKFEQGIRSTIDKLPRGMSNLFRMLEDNERRLLALSVKRLRTMELVNAISKKVERGEAVTAREVRILEIYKQGLKDIKHETSLLTLESKRLKLEGLDQVAQAMTKIKRLKPYESALLGTDYQTKTKQKLGIPVSTESEVFKLARAEIQKTTLELQKYIEKRRQAITKGAGRATLGDYDRTILGLRQYRAELQKTHREQEKLSEATIRLGGQTNGLLRFFSRMRNQLLVLTFAFAGLRSMLINVIQETTKYENALKGLDTVAKAFGQSTGLAKKAAQELAADGMMTVSEAAEGLKNLLGAGFGLPEAINLMYALKDAAAFNRQGTLAYGEAIVSATQGLKNQNSILLDNAGITKNLSVILKEAGYNMSDLGRMSTDAGVKMAVYNGIMKEARTFTGDAKKAANTLSGQLSQLNVEWQKMYIAVGQNLAPLVKEFVEALKYMAVQLRENKDEIFGNHSALMQLINVFKLLTNILILLLKLLAKIPIELLLLYGAFVKVIIPLMALGKAIRIQLINQIPLLITGIRLVIRDLSYLKNFLTILGGAWMKIVQVVFLVVGAIWTLINVTKKEKQVNEEIKLTKDEEISQRLDTIDMLIREIKEKEKLVKLNASESKQLDELIKMREESNRQLQLESIKRQYKAVFGKEMESALMTSGGRQILSESPEGLQIIKKLAEDNLNVQKSQLAMNQLNQVDVLAGRSNIDLASLAKQADELKGTTADLQTFIAMIDLYVNPPKPMSDKIDEENEKLIELRNETKAVRLETEYLTRESAGFATQEAKLAFELKKINNAFVIKLDHLKKSKEYTEAVNDITRKAQVTELENLKIAEEAKVAEQVNLDYSKQRTEFNNKVIKQNLDLNQQYQEMLTGVQDLSVVEMQHAEQIRLLTEEATKLGIANTQYIEQMKETLRLIREQMKLENERQTTQKYGRIAIEAGVISKGYVGSKRDREMTYATGMFDLRNERKLKEQEAQNAFYATETTNMEQFTAAWETYKQRLNNIDIYYTDKELELEGAKWEAKWHFMETYKAGMQEFNSTILQMTNTTTWKQLQGFKILAKAAENAFKSMLVGYLTMKSQEAAADAALHLIRGLFFSKMAAASMIPGPVGMLASASAEFAAAGTSAAYATLYGAGAGIANSAFASGATGGASGGGGGTEGISGGGGTSSTGTTITGTVQARELKITIAPVLTIMADGSIYIGSGSIQEFSGITGGVIVETVKDAIETGQINLNSYSA